MPHPSGTVLPGTAGQGWGDAWGDMKWADTGTTGGSVGGQVVIRHDRSTTKKKRLRQRQRMN